MDEEYERWNLTLHALHGQGICKRQEMRENNKESSLKRLDTERGKSSDCVCV